MTSLEGLSRDYLDSHRQHKHMAIWQPESSAMAARNVTGLRVAGHTTNAKEIPMSFLQVWFTGYYDPVKMIDELRSKPAPQWGFYAQLLRALMDSLLLYLPLALMGRVPPTPSNLSFIPTEQYYWHLIWLSPLVLGAEWLLAPAFTHLVLRLMGRHSDFDQILNINGLATLVVGAILIVWDWVWFTLGGVDQYFLGTSHLVIDLWGVVIGAIGLKRILGVPTWLGALLSFLGIPIALPLAIMFMRSPL